MRYIKRYKLFESLKPTPEDGFDAIYYINNTTKEYNVYNYFDSEDILNQKIKELNDLNDNFDPSIIKDFFIDFFDPTSIHPNGFIENIEVIKYYEVRETTATRKGKTEKAFYLHYTIKASIKISDIYSEEAKEVRKEYLKERDEIRRIIHSHYNHKSLNYDLSDWVIFDRHGMRFTRNEDYFDMWSKILWLSPKWTSKSNKKPT